MFNISAMRMHREPPNGHDTLKENAAIQHMTAPFNEPMLGSDI